MKSPAEAARAGTLPPVLLVRGDRVVAEPLALRLAAEVGETPTGLQKPLESVPRSHRTALKPSSSKLRSL